MIVLLLFNFMVLSSRRYIETCVFYIYQELQKNNLIFHRSYLTKLNFSYFPQGDCWICMELMSVSLDKFYKFVNNSLNSNIPEEILGKITVAVSI